MGQGLSIFNLLQVRRHGTLQRQRRAAMGSWDTSWTPLLRVSLWHGKELTADCYATTGTIPLPAMHTK